MDLIRAGGRLLAIGGGEDKEKACLILKEFVRLAGGETARILVFTTATDSPEEAAAKYTEVFKRLGAKQIEAINVSQRDDAKNPESIEKVKKATGIFFTGGDQLHITSLMGGTELQTAIMESYESGVIVGGTSAGAAMMGNSMIVTGDSDENPRVGSVEMAPGTDLIVGCIIDTHFSQRGRHGRLLTAVAHFPQDIGFGIDENTAMLIDKNKFEVIGEGAVTVIDGAAMSYSDVPYVEKGQSLALADVKIHVLPNSYKFDLKTREMIVPKQTPAHKAKAASLNENEKTRKK
jgi:cyanophycinase